MKTSKNENAEGLKGLAKGGTFDAGYNGDQRTGSDNEEESNFPDEWISIAAYYVWKMTANLTGTLNTGTGPKPN